MKLPVVIIAIFGAFLATQGCSSPVKSIQGSQQESQTTSSHSHPSQKQANNHQVNKHQANSHHVNNQQADNHQNHTQQVTQPSATIAKLTLPKEIKSTQAVPLVIDVQEKNGKAVSNFDSFQEKQMHLIVVSDDLRFFQHIHPINKGNGRFEVNPDFPAPGSYTLFSDYKPTGQQEQVSVQKLNIPGDIPLPTELEKFSHTKIVDKAKVSLKLPQKTLQAGKEVKLSFELQELNQNRPLKNLQPYLGEKGHLVIVRSSSPLTEADYIHAHASKDSPDGQINFTSMFPSKGTYKVWLQFQRDGKVNTADFWLNAL